MQASREVHFAIYLSVVTHNGAICVVALAANVLNLESNAADSKKVGYYFNIHALHGLF